MYFHFVNNKLVVATEHKDVNVDGAVVVEYDSFDNSKTYTLVNDEIVVSDSVEEVNTTNDYQYLHERINAYPSIHDQLDMQYWDMVNGTTVWKDTIEAIKAKYPKTGVMNV